MIKLIKNILLCVFVTVLLFCSLVRPVDAFSLANLNPFPYFHRAADIVVNRVADIINYLIMQEKYIFEGYTDPNVFTEIKLPKNIEKLTASTTKSESTTVTNNASDSVPVVAPTLPNIERLAPVQPTVVSEGVAQNSAPGLIVQTNIGNTTNNDVTSGVNINSDILSYTNSERTSFSLKPLAGSPILDKIADLRVEDIFANQYFEHASPDNKSATDLAKKLGYGYLVIGENLALGNFNGNQDIVSAWMDSPGHRANILNTKYTELGISAKTDIYKGQESTVAVQIFALPASNCPKPNYTTRDLIDTSSASVIKMQADAAVLYGDLTTMKYNPQVDRVFYNQKVQEYNYFAKKVNDAVLAIKNMVDIYNVEVARYNSCISSS